MNHAPWESGLTDRLCQHIFNLSWRQVKVRIGCVVFWIILILVAIETVRELMIHG